MHRRSYSTKPIVRSVLCIQFLDIYDDSYHYQYPRINILMWDKANDEVKTESEVVSSILLAYTHTQSEIDCNYVVHLRLSSRSVDTGRLHV